MRLRCWAAVCVTLLGLISPGFSNDREAARECFDKAREAHEALLQSPEQGRTARNYQAVITLYRQVLDSDPAFSGCDDALYWTANLYEEMFKRFGNESYRRRATYFYNFVAREYPTTKFKGSALERALALRPPEPAPTAEPGSPTNGVTVDFPRSPSSGSLQPSDRARPAETPAAHPGGDSQNEEIGRAIVSSIRYWSNQGYTRVVIALDREAKYTKEMLSSPDRMYLDLHNTRLQSKGLARTYDVNDLFIKQIRVGVNRPGTVRVVLDFANVKNHSLFALYDPFRLVIDTRGDALVQAAAPPQTAPKEKTAEAEIRLGPASPKKEVVNTKPVLPAPRKKGDLSLTRILGLKVGRVVLDPGHGGKDTGSVGPTGLLEKDLVLEVALRLKALLEDRLGTDVILTRSGDQFVPLEERTAIANQHNADLFISIHANSSRSRRVAGTETFFLSFASSPDEQEVASRENAGSQRNIRELEDLLKQIALGDYHAESRQLAELVQASLYKGMRAHRPNQKNRGVKKAPFIVLIGANMPSILSEVAFISNTGDEKYLKQDRAKDNVAESLYRGVAAYFQALGAVPLERSASTQ